MLRFKPHYGDQNSVVYINPAYVVRLESEDEGVTIIYCVGDHEVYVEGNIKEIADKVEDYLRPQPSIPKAPALEI